MFSIQIPPIKTDKSFRCEEHRRITDHRETFSPAEKNDSDIKESIYNAFWKDDVLRALEYYEIDVRVKNKIVYLNGHILSTTSQNRIENAVRGILGISEIKNNLILDENLNTEVAASLGELEHTYGCKFFIGTSHGVLSLNGTVSTENVKLLAEKCVANNPNVRAVINNVNVPGSKPETQAQPFLQPVIGENIYFLDGISGIVKQVIINPNNRCVIAMIVEGKFTNQQQDLKSLNNTEHPSTERLIVLRMKSIHYLTRVSGFLNIKSSDTDQYLDFDPAAFIAPNKDWAASCPYCAQDVLFPIEYKNIEKQITHPRHRLPFAGIAEDISFRKQFIANDSFGGYDG